MAEAVAAIGLISSIASLIDLGAKVTTRLRTFISDSTDVPESFRSLAHRLPLLVSTLKQISHQAQAGRLSTDAATALQSLIQSTVTQVSLLEACLAQITPPVDATRIRRAVKALQSLTKDGKIRTAVERVQQDIDFLVLHQTTHHVDTGERILDVLADLQLGQSHVIPVLQSTASFDTIVPGNARLYLGNVDYGHDDPNSREVEKFQACGLCWGGAPLIEADCFIGRAMELDQMEQSLRPEEAATEQRRLILCGLGGIGKTQLAIAYARRFQAHYKSVFWLNAASELSLRASFRSIAQRLSPVSAAQGCDDEGLLQVALHSLSDVRTERWLLIFDNYDDPDLYSIEDYLPNAVHGSVIITTRLPDLIQGQRMQQIRILPIGSLDESLEILRTRSQRKDVGQDVDAHRLAARLAGLPLALATAGAYLSKTTVTFGEYLATYERRFNVNPRRPTRLPEYRDRTLYTTWNLSYSRLEQEDLLASRALGLLAYFDNQQIWYELLSAGLDDNSPDWLRELVTDRIEFENVMGMLVDYGLIEAHPITRTYSIHNCVHDWILAQLNENVDWRQYWYAVVCVSADINRFEDETRFKGLRHARLTHHVSRIMGHRFLQGMDVDTLSPSRFGQLVLLARFLFHQQQLSAAEDACLRLLASRKEQVMSGCATPRDLIKSSDGTSKTGFPEHAGILGTLDTLGQIYRVHGKLDTAERMYTQALALSEELYGPDHRVTFDTLNNFSLVKYQQGQHDQAEQMGKRALVGHEKVLGADHPLTINAMHNLGLVYHAQGRLDEAEQMLTQALAHYETQLGSDHFWTNLTVNNLATLYHDQSQLDKAERMYLRALAVYQRVVGPNYSTTLMVRFNLGLLYRDQGKLDEAEQTFTVALAANEKTLGADHISTIDAVGYLGHVYYAQGRLDDTERMYMRAIAGYEKAVRTGHVRALRIIDDLGDLYLEQGKLDQAIKQYTKLLDNVPGNNVKKGWAGSIYELGKALALSVRRTAGSSSSSSNDDDDDDDDDNAQPAKSNLARLIRHFDKYDRPPSLVYWLARGLLWIGDEDNARFTFDQASTTRCDVCACKIGVGTTTGHHVCRQCADADLCDGCMDQWKDGSLEFARCEGHRNMYFDVVAAAAAAHEASLSSAKMKTMQSKHEGAQVDVDVNMNMDMDMEAWIKALKEKYPV